MGVAVEAMLAPLPGRGAELHELSTPAPRTPGCGSASLMGELALAGRDKLTFIVSEPIASFGLWVEQLIAESTGKQGRGVLPVAGEPVGEPPDYGEDRVFVYLRDAEQPDAGLDAKVKALADAGHPTVTLAVHGAEDLGRIFFYSEFATAVAGWVLEINPFDQPNVQEAKDNTAKVLDGYRSSGSLPAVEAADDGALRALLADAGPPHYVAIMGYLPPSPEIDEAIDDLRAAIRRATKRNDDLRLRTALPALDGPVPQGGTAARALPPARPRARRGRRDPRCRLWLRDAVRCAVRRRSADAARARPAGRARRLQRPPRRRRARTHEAHRGAARMSRTGPGPAAAAAGGRTAATQHPYR